MRIYTFAPLLLLGSLVAQSPLIYSNGPLITGPHSVAGAQESRLQSGAPPGGLCMNVIGFGAQQGAGNALADAFSVSGAMVIDGIEVFGYLTGGATAPSPVTGVFVTISSTDPATAITPVPNSPLFTANQIANTTHGWSNIYRTTATTTTATNRAVMSMRVNLANPIILTQGTYWLLFNYTGVNFTPPVTVMGSARMTTTPNTARQRVGAAGAWAALFDTPFGCTPAPAPFETAMPFNLYGSSAPQTGSITVSNAGGCGSTTLAVSGNPVPGGFMNTVLTPSGTSGLNFIGLGLIPAAAPACGTICIQGHDWSVALFGSTNRIDIPQDPTFVGIAIYAQGAEFLGVGGCPIGFTATDTWRYQL